MCSPAPYRGHRPKSQTYSIRFSLVAMLDSATTFKFGCEGTIRTCMNRVRAGYPGRLDDLATLRRERADTVCFLDKRSNRSLHHSSNFCSLLVNELPPLLTFQTGCRGAIRTPVSGFKVQSPATRRPGIKLSAVSLSCTARTRRPIHRGCGRVGGDLCEHGPLSRGDLRRAHNTAPMRAQFQNHRVQLLACS